jgi:hypothetical protein
MTPILSRGSRRQLPVGIRGIAAKFAGPLLAMQRNLPSRISTEYGSDATWSAR